MAKVWFITGSSRGLGRSLAMAVLANGGLVAATARNPQQLNDLVAKYPQQIYPIQLDVIQKRSDCSSSSRHYSTFWADRCAGE